ncbi:MAG: SsrA-binding protein SmpB [Bacteroidales bacterium]|nr:SsrA-binding protein SmpB [Bacteroidales bacterium]
MAKAKSGVVIRNKRASYEYELLDTYTAGIVLVGTEIKSIRAGRASLADAYCYFVGNELFVKNMNVAEYAQASYNRHEPERDRKLLLTRRELNKLYRATRQKGFTIVVTKLFIAENGYAKLTIALARGKRKYDKRESIKEKDMQREADRMARL